MDEQIIRYSYKQKEGCKVSIKFNGLLFSSYEIIRFLEQNESEDSYYLEFLPGIFIRKDQKYVNRVEREINKFDYSKRENPTLGVVFLLLFYRLKDKVFYENQIISLEIKVGNRRDSIEIFDKEKILYAESASIADPLQQEYNRNRSSESDYTIEFKWVDTTKIMYPFRSGGDGNRCRIKGIFQSLNLLSNYNDNEYVFFSEHEMFLASAESVGLIEECKKFTRCMDICSRFINNTYSQPATEKWYDEIELEEFNGLYKIINANHRVCIAKRFAVSSVYAKVYKYSEKKIAELGGQNRQSSFKFHTRGDNKKILLSFYEKIDKLGLGKDAGRHILQGLRGKDLIDYIERESGKSLYELARNQ